MAEPDWKIIPKGTKSTDTASNGVPIPSFSVLYDDVDVTTDLAQFVTSLTYTDNLDGQEADNLELQLEDSDGRWFNEWYPDGGAVLTVKLGYVGGELVECGKFEIDDISLSGPPSSVSVKALSAGITKALRTDRNIAYDETTLKGLAEAVAARHGLTLTGTVEAIKIERATQHKESDIKFLKRVGEEYGYSFSIRHKQLVFYKQADLRKASTVRTITMSDFTSDISRYELRDKIKGTAKSAEVAYLDPKTKKTVSYSVDADGKTVATPSADGIKIKKRTETKAQAKAKAQAAIDQASGEGTSGNMTFYGDAKLCSGVNIELKGFGRFDGTYQVFSSRHSVTRSSGFVTEIDIRRSVIAETAKQQADKSKSQKPKRGSNSGGGAATNTQTTSKKITYDLNKQGQTVPVPVRN